MPKQIVGVFTINYTLYTNAQPGNDIQFGMDFTLTNNGNFALTQLIFPATSVGNNTRQQWNIDNHNNGNDPQSLIFRGADNGIINDTPREISARNQGNKSTNFAVYRVDINKKTVQSAGISFRYSINTSDPAPVTAFKYLKKSIITNEQKRLILGRCNYIKFA